MISGVRSQSTGDSVYEEPGIVKITFNTWAKDSHDLFDYESDRIKTNTCIVKGSARIYGLGDTVYVSAEEDSIPLGAECLGKVLTTIDGRVQFTRKGGVHYGGRERGRRSWMVVRDIPGCEVELKAGDHVNLGRFRMNVRQIGLKGCDKIEDFDAIPIVTEAGSSSVCRICLDGPEPNDPLIPPCSCKGSIKHVHVSCLKQWIQIKNAPTQTESSIFLQPASCELCKSHIPRRIRVLPPGEEEEELDANCGFSLSKQKRQMEEEESQEDKRNSSLDEQIEAARVSFIGNAATDFQTPILAPLANPFEESSPSLHASPMVSPMLDPSLPPFVKSLDLEKGLGVESSSACSTAEEEEGHVIDLANLPDVTAPFVVLENSTSAAARTSGGLHIIPLKSKSENDGIESDVNQDSSHVVRLGRGHEADVRIADVSISRVHAELSLKDNSKVVVQDLKSKFGTLLAIHKSCLAVLEEKEDLLDEYDQHVSSPENTDLVDDNSKDSAFIKHDTDLINNFDPAVSVRLMLAEATKSNHQVYHKHPVSYVKFQIGRTTMNCERISHSNIKPFARKFAKSFSEAITPRMVEALLDQNRTSLAFNLGELANLDTIDSSSSFVPANVSVDPANQSPAPPLSNIVNPLILSPPAPPGETTGHMANSRAFSVNPLFSGANIPANLIANFPVDQSDARHRAGIWLDWMRHAATPSAFLLGWRNSQLEQQQQQQQNNFNNGGNHAMNNANQQDILAYASAFSESREESGPASPIASHPSSQQQPGISRGANQFSGPSGVISQRVDLGASGISAVSAVSRFSSDSAAGVSGSPTARIWPRALSHSIANNGSSIVQYESMGNVSMEAAMFRGMPQPEFTISPEFALMSPTSLSTQNVGVGMPLMELDESSNTNINNLAASDSVNNTPNLSHSAITNRRASDSLSGDMPNVNEPLSSPTPRL